MIIKLVFEMKPFNFQAGFLSLYVACLITKMKGMLA